MSTTIRAKAQQRDDVLLFWSLWEQSYLSLANMRSGKASFLIQSSETMRYCLTTDTYCPNETRSMERFVWHTAIHIIRVFAGVSFLHYIFTIILLTFIFLNCLLFNLDWWSFVNWFYTVGFMYVRKMVTEAPLVVQLLLLALGDLNREELKIWCLKDLRLKDLTI